MQKGRGTENGKNNIKHIRIQYRTKNGKRTVGLWNPLPWTQPCLKLFMYINQFHFVCTSFLLFEIRALFDRWLKKETYSDKFFEA